MIAPEASFLLAELEVFDWGPFAGKHRAEIDRDGTSIIGPTGSGKTTLIDALMTLLAPIPRYNLASTGGHESDRDLISYIRGVSEAGDAAGGTGHIARPGKTLTGLAATYRSGAEMVTIGALFWVDGASNAAGDLRRLWFFAEGHEGILDELLQLQYDGGKKAVTKRSRETVGLRTFSSKKEYLARLRTFFDVSENAFSLLNRAAGLKQLNSIDQIFRELVLDDRSAFDRAREVAGEFDVLKGIHEELETARRQRDSLLPVAARSHELEVARQRLAKREHLMSLLPVWFAEVAVGVWQVELERLREKLHESERELEQAMADERAERDRLDDRKARYLKLGGAAVEVLEANLAAKEELRRRLARSAADYWSLAESLDLAGQPGAADFADNRRRLPELREAAEQQLEGDRMATLESANLLKRAQDEKTRLENEIRAVKARPGSNLPAKFQNFREELGEHLGMKVRELPYVAELIEVKAEEAAWRGAIERAIGPERLRLLVPADRIDDALAWVNSRNNRLHVRLQQADPTPAAARFFDDGFTRKLNFRNHPLRETVKLVLSKRDRHCVSDAARLRNTDHGMTIEGTMSDRDGRFEKQDQRPLAEGWMTGFDNRHQMQELARRLIEAQGEAETRQSETCDRSAAEDKVRGRLHAIERLEGFELADIDLSAVERDLEKLNERIEELNRPGSEAAEAKAAYDAVTEKCKMLEQRVGDLRERIGGHKSKLGAGEISLNQALESRGEGLVGEDRKLARRSFSGADTLATTGIESARRGESQRIGEAIERARERISRTEQSLVRAMEAALKVDTGALAETGSELRDVPAYLDRLSVLEKEALPEKLGRFLEYLNCSSGQGVTQLLAHIENEVSLIEERIAELNETLSRVEFRSGRYLQLQPARVGHETLRRLDTAHRRLKRIALEGHDDEGGSHFRALGDVITIVREAAENRRTLGSQALLDPRHRLSFYIVEIERESGRSSGRRTGSQTGSGGEKEMMASYILTASLSYALCPPGATRPRYATIVLDEAFSKSSPAAAARIIEALRVFGLHPLFVTPNKEIALLKAHTRSAIVVHNKDRRATLSSLNWELLEERARRAAES